MVLARVILIGGIVKIHRIGSSPNKPASGAIVKPDEYVEDWKRSRKVRLNARLSEKGPATQVEVEIDDADVDALVAAKQQRVNDELRRLRKENTELRKAFTKVYGLMTYEFAPARSTDERIDMLKEIAWHYKEGGTGKPPVESWVKWTTL